MKKILIVEDDRKIALAVAVRLKANGYDVLTAFDAMAGLSLCVKNLPDLVILDISMPAGSGFDVAAQIRNLATTASTPIIFMTASRNPEFLTKAAELGAVAFIEKPFDDGELLSDVRHALGEEEKAERGPPEAGPPTAESRKAGDGERGT
jgi:DNA-binding response OmpR family regulator